MNADEIKKLKVYRVKCNNSLLFFTRYYFKKLKNQKFIVNWHHKEITEAIEDVFNYKCIFLNINIPPRCSKTELVLNAIAKGLGENPSGNYLYITASDDLRSEVSVKIRDIITSPEYKKMYGIELKKDQNAKNLWRTTQGGGLKTATISGQITGFGAGQMIMHDEDLFNYIGHDDDLFDYIRDFEGCIVLDDINKISDSTELNKNNEKVNNRIFDTVFSRTNSPDTPIINIQQRAGTEDATSKLIKYYEKEIEEGTAKNLVMPIVYPDGRLLWEWKFNNEKIEKLKTGHETAHMFETQYMQNPLPPEGIQFPKNKLNRFKLSEFHEENVIGKIGFIDPADEGDDFYSYPLGNLIETGRGIKIYITKVIFTTEGFAITEPRTVEFTNTEKVDHVYLETNKEGTLYYNKLVDSCPGSSVVGIHNKSTQSKIHRIIMQGNFIIKSFYFLEDEDQDDEYKLYFDQLTTFLKTGENKHDDAADSTAGLSKAARIIFSL